MKRSDQQNELESYWNDMSESVGEPVVAYNLGQYLGGMDTAGPLWGLIFITDTRLFFRHYPQENWFASIITNRRSRRGEEVAFELPLSEARLSEPPARTLLERLFSSRPRACTLSLPDGTEFLFSVEHTPERFLTALRPRCRA